MEIIRVVWVVIKERVGVDIAVVSIAILDTGIP
jgi:hypothetical protein